MKLPVAYTTKKHLLFELAGSAIVLLLLIILLTRSLGNRTLLGGSCFAIGNTGTDPPSTADQVPTLVVASGNSHAFLLVPFPLSFLYLLFPNQEYQCQLAPACFRSCTFCPPFIKQGCSIWYCLEKIKMDKPVTVSSLAILHWCLFMYACPLF